MDRFVNHRQLMFGEQPAARTDMTAGALYAIAGGAGWIYYGQITPEKKVGFFRRRDRELPDSGIVLESPIMSVVIVACPSIGRTVRAGRWKKLGRFPTVDALIAPQPSVEWSVGTLTVTVCTGPAEYDTSVDDPAIQNLELMAVWDAEDHIPGRLTADFGAEKAEWHVGGSIRRERQITEERARRFADAPWHRLPPDWVATDIR